jgi:SAM-dependent methyltransferase
MSRSPQARVASGAVPSPNIWQHPDIYELENNALDPDGLIEAAMAGIRDWAGATVLDVGCGTGYHLPRFAAIASRVIGVEPHAGLGDLARRRVAGLPHVSVHVGTAQALPLPDASVDVVHARLAYFFGPGCEPGLREISRVLRWGGAAFVVDHDASRSTFGRWFRRWLPSYDPAAVERFWARQGFTRRPLDVRFRFARREHLAAVLAVEFPGELVQQFLAEHDGLDVDYALNLWHRTHEIVGAASYRAGHGFDESRDPPVIPVRRVRLADHQVGGPLR